MYNQQNCFIYYWEGGQNIVRGVKISLQYIDPGVKISYDILTPGSIYRGVKISSHTGIPGARTTRHFTYPARDPYRTHIPAAIRTVQCNCLGSQMFCFVPLAFRLEPLIYRIHNKHDAVLVPTIEMISPDVLHISKYGGGVNVGGFSWQLHYTWERVPQREQHRVDTVTDTVRYTTQWTLDITQCTVEPP